VRFEPGELAGHDVLRFVSPGRDPGADGRSIALERPTPSSTTAPIRPAPPPGGR